MDKYFASRNPLLREKMREQTQAKMENKERTHFKAMEALAGILSDLEDGDWYADTNPEATRETELQFRRLGFRYVHEEL